MTESTPIQLEVETRFAGASAWQKSTIRMYDNGVITGYDAQGSSIGTINFDSYMGPDVIKKCRKPSKLGMLKTSFDRKNRYDFVKDGKVVLSINFNFPTGNEGSFRRMLSNFPERKHACLSGGRKKRRTRKRKNRRRKTRKNKRKRKRGGVKESNATDFPEQSHKKLQEQQLTHGKENLARSMFGLKSKKKKAALVHPIGGRKHKRSKKGRGIGPFGKQKPLSRDNKPNGGDIVRVRGQAGWTVITPMNRSAIVCPPGNTSSNQCSFGEQEIRYNEMTKMGFMGQMGLKKTGGKKRKSRKHKKSKKAKKSRKRGKHGGMDDMCINYKHKLDGHSDYVNRDDVTLEAGDKYCDIMFPIDKGNAKHKCNSITGKCTDELDETGMPITPISVGGKRKAKKSRKARR